jgi:putative ABC transport system permease protein
MMKRLAQDIRYALRGFRRTPTFVVAVVTILGLGIGATVAMITTVQAILLRRLPVVEQDRIAVLWPYREPGAELAPPATDLPELRRASRTMRDVAGVAHYGTWTAPFLDGDRTIVLATTPVSGNYFDVLGARPALGRLLRPEDEEPGRQRIVVLGYGFWQRQFAGSPSVLGRQLVEPYSRAPMTVVGVAPPGLDYPVGVDAWTPIVRGAQVRVFTVARLRPAATVDAARAEFISVIGRLEPGMELTGAGAKTFTGAVLGDARPILIALTAAVSLLLLIACVNVGTLSLARTNARAREFAIRRALGASYGDLVRQLVVESALLAIGGGALGVALAASLLRALVRIAPPHLPRLDAVRLHAGLLGAGAGVTALAVLLFGLLPSIAAARVQLASPLRQNDRSGTEMRHRHRIRQWLVGSQVALAVVMLTGAGLLTRSVLRLEGLELGYRTEHLSIVSIAPDQRRYDTPEKQNILGDQLERRLRAVAGVTAVTPMQTRPFDGAAINHGFFEAEGQAPADADASPAVPWEAAGSEYFRVFGIPLLAGRGFQESDREGTPPVVVVSASVARRIWPGQDPVGERLRLSPSRFGAADGVSKAVFDWRTVVGVVPDTRLRTLREASPTIYVPWRQLGWPGSLLAVRSAGEPGSLAAAIRFAVRDVDPTLAVWGVRSMEEELGRPLQEPRLYARLLAAFSVLALVLAAVGIYGVMASAVREQTRDIGIRVALGATPSRIRRAVLRQALVVAGAGIGVGLAGALTTTRVLRALLFEVAPTDPIALLGACAVLLAVALGAALLPARAAAHVDPARTLRTD